MFVLLGAVVLLAGWVAVELRVPVPFIDLGLMRIRGVWTANLVALLIGVAIYASFSLLPQFLQTPEQTGYGLGATLSEASLMWCRPRRRPFSPACAPHA